MRVRGEILGLGSKTDQPFVVFILPEFLQDIRIWHQPKLEIANAPLYFLTARRDGMKNTPIGPKSNAAFVVKRFVEKPTLPVARRLIRQHGLWNSGIFIWKASTLLAALRRYQPAIYQSLEKIKAAAPRSLTSSAPRLRNAIAEQYNQMPNVSIDYAVMRKLEDVLAPWKPSQERR